MRVSFRDFVSIDELPSRAAGSAKVPGPGPGAFPAQVVERVPGARSFGSWHPPFLVPGVELLPASAADSSFRPYLDTDGEEVPKTA